MGCLEDIEQIEKMIWRHKEVARQLSALADVLRAELNQQHDKIEAPPEVLELVAGVG